MLMDEQSESVSLSVELLIWVVSPPATELRVIVSEHCGGWDTFNTP